MEHAWSHTTVLLNEAVSALVHDPDGHYIDATYGRGGHSRLILSRLGARGRLSAFDKDPEAVADARRITDPRFEIRHDGFAALGQWPPASAAGILMDLGISSPQIDNPARGFSFRADGPLDMRMDPTRGESAAQWLARAPVAQIEEVIREFGEERFAGRIARAVVAHRQQHGPLARTAELAALVAREVRTREPGQDPATRTFQALRIFVNAELDQLREALTATLDVLQDQGMLVVISFHSLEDRIVKSFIAGHSREVHDRRAPFAPAVPLALQAVGRVKPTDAEVKANPRARSAIMRVARRTSAAVTAVAAQAGGAPRAGGRRRA